MWGTIYPSSSNSRSSHLKIVSQERGGGNSFTHGSLALKYKLDNEFELVFVVSVQLVYRINSD